MANRVTTTEFISPGPINKRRDRFGEREGGGKRRLTDVVRPSIERRTMSLDNEVEFYRNVHLLELKGRISGMGNLFQPKPHIAFMGWDPLSINHTQMVGALVARMGGIIFHDGHTLPQLLNCAKVVSQSMEERALLDAFLSISRARCVIRALKYKAPREESSFIQTVTSSLISKEKYFLVTYRRRVFRKFITDRRGDTRRLFVLVDEKRLSPNLSKGLDPSSFSVYSLSKVFDPLTFSSPLRFSSEYFAQRLHALSTSCSEITARKTALKEESDRESATIRNLEVEIESLKKRPSEITVKRVAEKEGELMTRALTSMRINRDLKSVSEQEVQALSAKEDYVDERNWALFFGNTNPLPDLGKISPRELLDPKFRRFIHDKVSSSAAVYFVNHNPSSPLSTLRGILARATRGDTVFIEGAESMACSSTVTLFEANNLIVRRISLTYCFRVFIVMQQLFREISEIAKKIGSHSSPYYRDLKNHLDDYAYAVSAHAGRARYYYHAHILEAINHYLEHNPSGHIFLFSV